MPTHVVIVIPTYNERNNILGLIEAIKKQKKYLPKKMTYSLLIVDDSSPDGTGDVVRMLAKRYANVYLLQGRKRGLGVAYIRGFRYAMNHMAADIVIQMDADLSHNPGDIPRLLSSISKDTNFVIGSRYVTGGAVDKEWPLRRRINSSVANFLARHIAGIKGVDDCTSGFRAIQASFLKKIDLQAVGATGYSFQMNLLHAACRAGAVVAEVPITFADRTEGHSKMRLYDILEFVVNAFHIRLNQWRESLKNRLVPYAGPSRHFDYIILVSIILISGTLFTTLILTGAMTPKTAAFSLFALFSLLITIQSGFTLWGMIYSWEEPERVEANKSPRVFQRPQFSFSVLLPALHEEAVIGETIRAIATTDYPESLKEILVICRADDTGTITAARETIAKLGKDNIHVLISNEMPKNKPDKLNFGLKHATKDVVCIFDAEDSPHQDIFRIVNTVMTNEEADVVQSGVQLTNFRSHWFSTLNVLEYYFWFKSVLHLFSRQQVIPLGGNTVFFKHEWLKKVGGWDADCLTEDADIGIKLSVAGAKIRIIYDELHATQEETPSDVTSFIKQRTRWNQGFLQIFKKFEWSKLPNFSQRMLITYILIWPEIQAAMFVYIILSIVMIFTVKLPIILALVSTLPLYILFMHFIILNIGLYEFTKSYQMRYPWWMPLKIVATFIPFQLLLGFSAFRAVFRELRQQHSWEKTTHVNAHRTAQEPIRSSLAPSH